MSQFFASGGQSFGASATCSGIKSLNLSRCWFSHLYYGKQASSIRCISTTVSDSRHYGEHLSGPSKIGLQGKNNLQYFPRVLPSLAAMEIEFALDWEKSLIPQRIEGQSCRGLRLKVASNFSICSPSQLHAWSWFTGLSGGEQECLCAQHHPS